jgi:hypothetical protein
MLTRLILHLVIHEKEYNNCRTVTNLLILKRVAKCNSEQNDIIAEGI